MNRTDALSEEQRSADSIRIPIFVGALLLTARAFPFAPELANTLPTNTLGLAILVMVAIFGRPKWRFHEILVSGASILLVAWLLFTTFVINSDLELRRSSNILLLFLAAAFIGSGRLHFRSLQTGALTGFVVTTVFAVVVHLMNPSASGYEGRLSGLMGDPNATGFIVLAIGLALAQSLRSNRTRLVFVVWISVVLWLTVSRTSMFAGIVGLSWVLVGRRIPRFVSIAGLFFVTWFYGWANEYSERRGWFVEREGSDNLRERLLVVEKAQVAEAGWTGNGLGTAVADLDSITLFFHNSYLAMQAEGGRIALYLLYALMAGLFLMFHKLPSEHRPVWAEASLITVAITSINIGFSLTSPATAVAIGFFLYHHCSRREALKAEGSVPEHYAELATPQQRMVQ